LSVVGYQLSESASSTTDNRKRTTMKRILLVLLCALPATALRGQTATDSAGIRQAALDYIEGYYTGNAERMERALHPELAKRIVQSDDRGRQRLGQMSAATLIQGTREGGGRDTPDSLRRHDVTILDIYQNAASAKIYASYWVDYLHLAKWHGRWVIVNVLWEMHPQPRGQ
jgi:hypothetical protein